jgi:serine/threonine protein kinase
VGRFRPLGILGSGGGGIVYLANDPVLNRRVAVKVPKVNGSLSDFPFLTEARAAARLKHPHVVQIFDVGSLSDGRMFIAMELVSGGSLAARLKRQHLTWQEAAKTVAQVASAIDVAHQNKLLHRDLKPSNVLLDEHGNTKVADFGLSLSTDDTLFAGTSITGTPAYMSPEQASGNADQLTPKTDIWSIGVILYEALTGKRPFFASQWLDLQHQILNVEPVALRTINPKIPRGVETLCLECLRKKPGDRPASAAVIAEQLQAAVRHSENARRRIAGACVMVLFLGLASWAWLSRPVQPKPADQLAVSSVAISATQKDDTQAEVRWPAPDPELRPIVGELDLLTIAPEVWDFKKADATSILSIDPQSKTFSTASSYGGIFAWPVQMPKQFRWETRLSYSQDGTEITLAWSMHPAIVDNGWNGYESDVLAVSRDRNKLYPKIGRTKLLGRPGTSLDPLGSSIVQRDTVDGSADGDLIAIDMLVSDGALKALQINGVPVDHRHPPFPAFDPPPRSVQPALFVGRGRLTVVSSRITALEDD